MASDTPHAPPQTEAPPPTTPKWRRPPGTFESSLVVGIVVQVVLLPLSALNLDSGHSLRVCCIAAIGYWCVVAAISARRRAAPTSADLLFLRWGVPGLIVVELLLAKVVYRVIGESHLSGVERWF